MQTKAQSIQTGWQVVIAGFCINLALGILYTWSIFKDAIKNEFGWQLDQLNDPYALCVLVFSFTMILAGYCQDKWGPKLTIFIGGLLVGSGFFILSSTNSYALWLLGFGVFCGTGIAFAYASATPSAIKWFPDKTGFVVGLVIAGFGLAPAYLAPLSTHLLAQYGLLHTALILGVAFTLAVCALSQLIVNPPTHTDKAVNSPLKTTNPHSTPSLLKQSQFWLLWVLYFIGAGAGLMVIGSISGMAKHSMGEQAFIALVLLAIGNAGGRIISGLLSDKFGRKITLIGFFIFQALMMFLAVPIVGGVDKSAFLLMLIATLIGLNYGSNLSLFPSLTKDLWGVQNFGTNYGFLFTAWGVGGFVMSRLEAMLFAMNGHGDYTSSFVAAGVLLVIGAALATLIQHK